MRFSVFYIQVLLVSVLFSSNVQNHLKKALNKPSNCSIRNIDYIYMINLDERPEKWNRCKKALNKFGINPYRFSAVNGWNLKLKEIQDLGLKFDSKSMFGGIKGTSYLDESLKQTHAMVESDGQIYFCHCTSRGVIGIVLSHLSVIRDALDSGYNTIWVMEDDIDIIADPNQISDTISRLDKSVGERNWDILFTDRNSRDKHGNDIIAKGNAKRPNFKPSNRYHYYINRKIGNEFIRVGARFGAYSMIIRKSGMRKIYDFITKYSIFLPYDMDYYLAPGMKMYTVQNNIVSNQIRAVSDNGRPNYLREKKLIKSK